MNALACQLNTLLVIVIKCYFIAYYIFLSREQKYLCLFCSLHFTKNNNKMFGFQVWDLATLQCIQTLSDHTDVVMSVLCWDQFLLSCSLDQTIKVWAATESGNLEVTYTHKEEQGALALSGMPDAQSKPVLLCSLNDNTVRLYDLPSFSDRGRIFSKQEIRAIQMGPGGLFFTGDGTGELKVWQWVDAAQT